MKKEKPSNNEPNNSNIPLKHPFFTGVITAKPAPIMQPIYLTQTTFAYGFWQFKYNKDIKGYELKGLYHEGIRSYLTNQGYFKRYVTPKKSILIKQDGCIIDEVSPENVKDDVLQFVYSLTENINISYVNQEYSIPIEGLRTIFLQQSNNFFNENWLEQLPVHETPILKDTEYKSYFVFLNCLVQVSKKGGVEHLNLNAIDEFCIWKSQCIDKYFNYIPNCLDNQFAKFCNNVTSGIEGRFEALRSAIGYLSHFFFNPSIPKSVILNDEALTDYTKPMGGTGKGLIAKALSLFRSLIKIDGKHWKPENRFKLEMVRPFHQVVWIDDPKKGFDLEDLFSCLTDGWTLESKYNAQVFIAAANSPKLLVCSNVAIRMDGLSDKRRQFVIELNDYYSRKLITGNEKPIEDEHGILFSNKWKQNDWDSFFSFMIDSVRLYLENGLMEYELKNVRMNYLQQKTTADFVEWVITQKFELDKDYNTTDCFLAFKAKYYGENVKFDQRCFTNWLKLYAVSVGAKYKNTTTNGISSFLFENQN